MEKPTEESLFRALYWSQYRQGAAVCRHASVGEPHQYVTRGVANRAQHSVRRIDALVIRRSVAKGDSFWAVEVKVTLADLRRELSTPDKTEAWAQYVHAFYFLVPPSLLDVALAEVPPQYGVMVGKTFPEVKRRARRNPSPLPIPLDTWRRIVAKLGEHQIEPIEKARRDAFDRQYIHPTHNRVLVSGEDQS